MKMFLKKVACDCIELIRFSFNLTGVSTTNSNIYICHCYQHYLWHHKLSLIFYKNKTLIATFHIYPILELVSCTKMLKSDYV